jgi:diguanylate cyclase (GGDEF)-like protein
MSDTDSNVEAAEKPNQKEQLLSLFAARVLNQARVVIDAWQRLIDNDEWDLEQFEHFTESAEDLVKFSIRFEKPAYQVAAEKIVELGHEIDLDKGAPKKKQITQLTDALQELKHLITRKSDSPDEHGSLAIKKPIFIALDNTELSTTLNDQLSFFGFITETPTNKNQFLSSMLKQVPAFIVMDVNFGGIKHAGIELINTINESRDHPITTVFYTDGEDGLETRLAAARAKSERFYAGTIDPRLLIETIEAFTVDYAQTPYRILVVDDSESQAHYTAMSLKKAGMQTHMIINPLEVMDAIEEFNPELIIMDMYMPGCNGMELAKIIRQENRYVSMPIIYLSSEDDIDKQLAALSEGGDDFLTKPVKPNRLVITVRNRVNRARDLMSLMVSDSLTGLFNHTHILYKLENELAQAKKQKTSLAFCMVDIDFFKKINDNYGHPVGDGVIRNLSLYLKQRLRKSDIIGRYGGEEFAIVLPNTTAEEAMSVMDTLRSQFAGYRQKFNAHELQVTFSCGIAIFDKDHVANSEKEIAERADKALYHAKENGRNCVSLYDKAMEKNSASSSAQR